MGHKSAKKRQNDIFSFLPDSCLPSIPKWSLLKAFSPVISVLLTLSVEWSELTLSFQNTQEVA